MLHTSPEKIDMPATGKYYWTILAVSITSLLLQLMALFYSSSTHIRREIREDDVKTHTYGRIGMMDVFNRSTIRRNPMQQFDNDSRVRELEDNTVKAEETIFLVPDIGKKLLTIGIPTLRRKETNYLFQTIDSLLENTDENEMKEIIIVVFLADNDTFVKAELGSEIHTKYENYITSGVIRVIQAPMTFYSKLSSAENIYMYSEKQNIWKSKQNFDYAYMQLYSQHLSTFYMQMEDDVRTVPHYLIAIKDYINAQTSRWVCLEFSALGFIGKLYHSRDIVNLANMLLMFHEYQPVDFTFSYLNILMGQFQPRLRRPSLFQHLGYHSSLEGKIQPLQDKFFDDVTKEYSFKNPPAKIYTTIPFAQDFSPDLAYLKEDGYFWSSGSPGKGDTFTIVFQKPEEIKRIIILTGSKEHPEDKIFEGILEASLTFVNASANSVFCKNDVHLAAFRNGFVDVTDLIPIIGQFTVECLRITLTGSQKNWVIIREIVVFCKNSTSSTKHDVFL